MDHCPRRCGEVYNLGNSEPIAMETIAAYLEMDLERKAVIVSVRILLSVLLLSPSPIPPPPPSKDRQPLPPSDLHATCADISESQRVLNYQPNITAREGEP